MVGTLTDIGTLFESASAANAVIHIGLSQTGDRAEIDAQASAAALAGVGAGPCIHTRGGWIWGNTPGLIDETAPHHPPARVAWRVDTDRTVLAGQHTGQHPVIIAPGIVYGRSRGLIQTDARGSPTMSNSAEPGVRLAL